MAGTVWSMACLAGLWGFVGCTVALILNGFPARDSFDGKSALRWGGGVLLCFIVWIIGMTQA